MPSTGLHLFARPAPGQALGHAAPRQGAAHGGLVEDVDAAHRRRHGLARTEGLAAQERHLISAFLALLAGETTSAEHYAALLRHGGSPLADLMPMLWIEAAGAMAARPQGLRVGGGAGDRGAPVYRVSGVLRARIGDRLATALEDAHDAAVHPGRTARAPAAQGAVRGIRPGAGLLTLTQRLRRLARAWRDAAAMRADRRIIPAE